MSSSDTGRRYLGSPVKVERELTTQEKLERHREYGADQTMHEYTINGVVIKATSKKVALKIYRRNYYDIQTKNNRRNY